MKANTHEVIAAALAPVVARQTVTQRLLAAAKTKQGIPSNYRLARVLDVADTTMTRWSQGRGSAADNIAVQLADMAGLDAGLVLVELAAERAQDDVTRSRLQGVVERLRQAGMAAIVGAICTFGAPPEAKAYGVGQHADQSDAVRYVNRRKRRRAPGGRRKGDAPMQRKRSPKASPALRLH